MTTSCFSLLFYLLPLSFSFIVRLKKKSWRNKERKEDVDLYLSTNCKRGIIKLYCTIFTVTKFCIVGKIQSGKQTQCKSYTDKNQPYRQRQRENALLHVSGSACFTASQVDGCTVLVLLCEQEMTIKKTMTTTISKSP